MLCYFLEIKKRLSTAFYPQTDGQTKRQNSTIQVYLRVFVNWEQNDWARLLPIAKFAYINTKNASIGHMLFKLIYGFHPQVSFKYNVNLCFRSSSTNKVAKELTELMNICQQNLFYAQAFQKRAHNKGVKPWNYAAEEKIWLNSKYIKTK